MDEISLLEYRISAIKISINSNYGTSKVDNMTEIYSLHSSLKKELYRLKKIEERKNKILNILKNIK